MPKVKQVTEAKTSSEIVMECTLDALNIKNDGNVRIMFKVPASDMAASVKLLTLKGNEIPITIIENTGSKLPRLGAVLNSLKFDNEGESRAEFLMDGSEINVTVAQLSALTQDTIKLSCKVSK